MTTNIIFKIDAGLKKAAQQKAKKEGIALSSLYQFATRSFVEGRLDLSLQGEALVPNKKTAAFLRRAMHTPLEKMIVLENPQQVGAFLKTLNKKSKK